MVEGARLESVYRSKAYRGFESLPLCNAKPLSTDFKVVKGFFAIGPHLAHNRSKFLIIAFAKMVNLFLCMREEVYALFLLFTSF